MKMLQKKPDLCLAIHLADDLLNLYLFPHKISSPGMKFSVQLLEPVLGHVGVNLGGRDVRMAEHHLDGPQVGSAFQEVAGEGMPGCEV